MLRDRVYPNAIEKLIPPKGSRHNYKLDDKGFKTPLVDEWGNIKKNIRGLILFQKRDRTERKRGIRTFVKKEII
jgi:hypothetical protein